MQEVLHNFSALHDPNKQGGCRPRTIQLAIEYQYKLLFYSRL